MTETHFLMESQKSYKRSEIAKDLVGFELHELTVSRPALKQLLSIEKSVRKIQIRR